MTKKIVLAGGCFWGLQDLIRKQTGVIQTRVGYTGGKIINPTTLNQQGNDRGTSYRSAIFYGSDEEKKEAQNFIDIVNKSKRWKDPVVTTLEPLAKFYLAEDYHQDYLEKNPGGYTCHAIYFDSYLKP